jgi:hypothetical protein
VIEHGDAVAGEKIAQAVAPARDRGLGDAEEDFGRLCGKAGGAHRRQGRDGLHQRLAGAAGFRYRDEARRGERQPCQQRRIGVGIEIVHEVQARAVAQSAEPRHPASCATVWPPRLDPPVPRKTMSAAPASSRSAAPLMPARSSVFSGSRSKGSLPSAWRALIQASASALCAKASA